MLAGAGVLGMVAVVMVPLTGRDGEPFEVVERCTVRFDNGREIELPAARTPEQHLVGLSFRDEPEGMVFVWTESKRAAFWMRDARFPIRAVWFDNARRISGIADMAPLTETVHRAPSASRESIELPPAWYDELGLQVGVTKIRSLACRSAG